MSKIALFQQVLFILFGNGDGLLRTLVLFVVIDSITGVMVAVYPHELSSKIGGSTSSRSEEAHKPPKLLFKINHIN